MTRTTIVTHPDGTVSTRTSVSRVYTHAVVVEHTREARVTAALAHAAAAAGEADKYEAAAVGEVTEERRKAWADRDGNPRQQVSILVGGVYGAGYFTPGEDRPTDEYARGKVTEYATRARERQAHYESKAARLAKGPDRDYLVGRWSSRKDLADKAAAGSEFARLRRNPGVTVTVVECQELVKGARK